MKKTLIIITAITLLFTACNADATSGLFRTATQAREAIDVKYEQILGIKNDILYFRTSKGIYSQAANKQPTLLVASKEGSIIQSAALKSDGPLIYKTSKNNGSLFNYNLSTQTITPITTPLAPITDFRLMPNGRVLLINEGSSGTFWIADSDNITTKIDNKNLDSGFGLDGLFTPSNYKDSTESKEFLLSFVGLGEYKNYYFDSSGLEEVKGLTEAIANFAVDSGKLYVLTVNGKLYYYASSPYTTPILLADSSSEFGQYGIFYPLEDSVNQNIHFITNPRYSDSMTVFTVVKANPEKDTTKSYNIKLGYAATLKDTTIVSTLALDDDSFLAATEKHGMYSVIVDSEKVNKNDSTNVVEISKAEEYEFW